MHHYPTYSSLSQDHIPADAATFLSSSLMEAFAPQPGAGKSPSLAVYSLSEQLGFAAL